MVISIIVICFQVKQILDETLACTNLQKFLGELFTTLILLEKYKFRTKYLVLSCANSKKFYILFVRIVDPPPHAFSNSNNDTIIFYDTFY